MIPSLKEEDGTITTNRDRLLERSAEFYQKLYEDTVQKKGGRGSTIDTHQ